MAVIRTALLASALNVAQFGLSATGFAESIDAVRGAYIEGRFLEAVELAEGVGSAEALSLANLSLINHGYYIAAEDEKREIYERAMALGERAAALDPEDPESLLYWSHAMGRYMKQIGVLKAAGSGFVGKVRKLAEAALALDPEFALAHTTLGAWHAEGIKEGGFMARAVFKASKKKAREHFEQALELAPNTKAVVYEYGRGQLNLNKRKNRERALELFERALAIPAANAAGTVSRPAYQGQDRIVAGFWLALVSCPGWFTLRSPAAVVKSNPAASISLAAAMVMRSPYSGPMICTPMGNP